MGNLYLSKAAIVLSLLCSGLFRTEAQAGPQLIRHLPNLTINGFVQDQVGYVWIATNNGLCRYNGQVYRYYQHESEEPYSLPDNRVHALHVDDSGVLWIVSDSGISTYDSGHDGFESVLRGSGLHGIVPLGSRIVCYGTGGMVLVDAADRTVLQRKHTPRHCPAVLESDGKEHLWGGLPGKRSALLRYDRDLNLCDSAALPRATEFRSSCRDTLGRIWFGLQQGIFVLDPETRQAAADPALTRCANRMSGHCVTMLFPDRSGTVHIGTQGSNIHMFNVPNGVAEYNIAYRFHLSHTSDFRCGFSDSENNIWIGTGDRGYAVRHSQRKNFNSASRLARLTQGKYINAVSARKDGTLWIGSRYKGLLAYNPDAPALWYTVSNCDFMSRIASNGIESLHTGSDERLWININDRIVVCTTDRSRITGHTLLAERATVNRFCEDSGKRMWAATEKGIFVWKDDAPAGRLFAGCDVQDIIPLDDDRLLAAVSGRGIFTVSTRDFSSSLYLQPTDSMTAGALRRPSCLLRRSDGSLWIGTRFDGVVHYAPRQGFRSYTLHSGMASNEISDMTEDAIGNVWVSTSYGLSLISPAFEHVITYFQSDRLQTQQFCPHCSLSSPTALYFGGNTGLAQFSPQRILSKISQQPVPLVLREIRVNSVALTPSKTGPLTKPLNDTERIVLGHKQRNIDISYEAVAFLSPEKIRFAYRLCGRNVDNEWQYVENLSMANYSHLPAGHYVFELKARNPDGFWNEEPRRLEIVVRPSPLLTWYAFLVYALVIVGGTGFANRLYLHRKRQKMELELARTKLKREEELTNMKINFFTNISHELRTPLSLIYGPVNMLPGVTDKNWMRELIGLINYNVQKLLDLVDQTLALSRIENDTLPLSVCRQDILPHVRRLMNSFTCYAREKEITVDLDLPAERLVVAVDIDKFGKILSNLVSNALKYTPKEGHVEVRISLETELPAALAEAVPAAQYLTVSVTDNGIGMSEEDVSRIFERYKRLTHSERSTAGTGIGLHYVKQLLLVHKGSIAAEVRPEGGMRFTFAIPVDESLYELTAEPATPAEFINGLGSAAPIVPDFAPEPDGAEVGTLPKIVIVEDNLQLLYYCKMIFAHRFRVLTADNGADGLTLIHDEMPDVVITDVLMSQMDGYELCHRIKHDLALSHIPVVILTAKISDQDKITGYQEGADVYMTKPFSPELLQTVVDNLLTSRKRLRDMLLSQARRPQEAEPENGEIHLSAADRTFMDKLCGIIDENISDNSLSTDTVCTAMCMSRASLFRKIKSLTGVSLNRFILIYRLNRAAEMVRSREYRFNEIADMLGFSTQSHFSYCFKQQFGMSPREYASRS